MVTSASTAEAGVADFFPPPDLDLDCDEAAAFFCAAELLPAVPFLLFPPAAAAGGAGVPPAL